MSSNDYDEAFVGGSKGLNLKGASDGSKKKKKKSKSSSSTDVKSQLLKESTPVTQSNDDAGTSNDATAPVRRTDKTAAELRFEAVQRQRLADNARKAAKKSHKDRVAEFNEKLEKMSEHYDIPKVGPG